MHLTQTKAKKPRKMPQSFNPVIFPETKFLIIGTMPSEASLKAQEYYAFKQNAFWKIVADIADCPQTDNYEQKLNMLQKIKAGLWDNLQYCEREGSLDSNIRNEFPNDFTSLLQNNPQIKKLLFNGQKSLAFFKKYHSDLLKKYYFAVLPSTSPANASINYQNKLASWKSALTD